jgi:hypothetical protein
MRHVKNTVLQSFSRCSHLKTFPALYNYPCNKKLGSSCWIARSIQRAGDKSGARVCTAQEVWFNYSLWLQEHNINKGVWGVGQAQAAEHS